MRDIRIAVGNTGRAVLMRNNVGFCKDMNIAYGLGKGSPDLVGIRFSDGKFIGIGGWGAVNGYGGFSNTFFIFLLLSHFITSPVHL